MTEEETTAAIDSAKRDKYHKLESTKQMERERIKREQILAPWQPEQMFQWIVNDRPAAFGYCAYGDGRNGRKVFAVDDNNRDVLVALSYYFSNNPNFETLSMADGKGGVVHMGWKLDKGILLAGSVGVGKTAIMKLFSTNKRMNYDVLSCKELSYQFQKRPEDGGGLTLIKNLSGIHRKQPAHITNFNTEDVCACFDDMGTEQEVNVYGNKTNVIADIMLERYANYRLPRYCTHATTNLDADGIEKFYGPRVWSRILEMFNVIDLGGSDRRKQ